MFSINRRASSTTASIIYEFFCYLYVFKYQKTVFLRDRKRRTARGVTCPGGGGETSLCWSYLREGGSPVWEEGVPLSWSCLAMGYNCPRTGQRGDSPVPGPGWSTPAPSPRKKEKTRDQRLEVPSPPGRDQRSVVVVLPSTQYPPPPPPRPGQTDRPVKTQNITWCCSLRSGRWSSSNFCFLLITSEWHRKGYVQFIVLREAKERSSRCK